MNIRRIPGSYYPWILVAILWFVALLNYLDRLLIASMREPIANELVISDAQFGLLTSVFLWIYGILSPFGGFFADRYGRKKVIVLSLFVWSAVTFWSGVVNSFPEMLAARAVMGISEACYIPAALAMIADYHKGPTRSLATGLHISGLYAGMALGGIGGFIADAWGWRQGFLIFGIAGIIYGFIVLLFLKDFQPVAQKGSESVQQRAENKNTGQITLRESLSKLMAAGSYRIMLIYICIVGMTFWVIYTWLPTYLREQFNLNLGGAGISATGFIQVASFIGVIAGGFIADRWSKSNIRGRLYLPVIGFTIGCPLLFIMATTETFAIAVAGMIGFGIARGFHDSNLMPVMCQVTDSRLRATGYGLLNFVSTISGGIMVYTGGLLRDENIGLSVVFRVTSVLLLLSGWLLLAVKPEKDN